MNDLELASTAFKGVIFFLEAVLELEVSTFWAESFCGALLDLLEGISIWRATLVLCFPLYL